MKPSGSNVLTQDDIDRVIQQAKSAEAVGAPETGKHRKVKIYDFTRPDKFSKEQTRVIQIMHESFARLSSAALSAQLRCLVLVHVASVDQLTYEEFVRSVPNPTTLARVHMDPLKGEAILEIDPSITFTMVDRSFGGDGTGFRLQRELTSIENAVIEGIVARLLGNLREAWSMLMDLRPRVGGIECNPMFAYIVPPTEMVLLVTLETKIGEVEGMMNLCIPYLTIEDVVPRLSQQFYYTHVRRAGRTVAPVAPDLPLDVEVYYEAEKLSLGELTRLRRGSLVRIPGHQGGQAILRAGGAPLSRLQAKRVRGRRQHAYDLADFEGGTSLAFLGKGRKPASAQEKPDALQLAVQSFSKEIGGAMKSIEGKISGLARKQEELQDQLIFRSPDKEVSAVEEVASGKRPVRPFHFLTISACEPLAALIGGGHPQLIALVLSYLQPALAACVLGKLPEATQTDVAARIVGMGRTLPETLREVERVLEMQMRVTLSEEYVVAGGIDAMSEILGVADRALERRVIGSLEAKDPEMAEAIKQRMLVVEDVVLLNDRDVQKVLRELEMPDLAKALKGVDAQVQEKIFRNMSQQACAQLKEDMQYMGPVRLKDVDQAQQKIVSVIRKLEEQGMIEIPRAGESESLV